MRQVRHGLDGLLERGVADLVQEQRKYDGRTEREHQLVNADDDRVAQHATEERILEKELEILEIVPRAPQDSLHIVVIGERHQHAVDRQILEHERQRYSRQQHEVKHPHALRSAPAFDAQGVPQLVIPGPRAKTVEDRGSGSGSGCRLRGRQRYLPDTRTAHPTAVPSRRPDARAQGRGCRLLVQAELGQMDRRRTAQRSPIARAGCAGIGVDGA